MSAAPPTAEPPASTAALLEQHFDTAFAAPDGLKKLRELILTLAMQGKLVAQDPSDPPARELLKDIEQEKRRLVAAGRLKVPKPLPPIEADEVPYEVPDGWAWVRLGDVTKASDSGWSPQCLPEARSSEQWGVLKVSAVSWGSFRPDENKALPIYVKPKPEMEVKAGDFLISRANTDELVARSVIIEETPSRLMMSDKIVRFLLSDFVDKQFINTCNLVEHSRNYYIKNASGTSSSMKNVSREVMVNLPISLPPLPEQRRIVAKIDELMARCDELEALRAAQQQQRLNVHTAALSRLLGASEPQAFAQAWQFVAQHFGDLYTVPQNVAELRKAVLQLAVMGKLVEQDPSDPPASELLKEIEQEKRRLVAAGKIKAPKPLPSVKPEDRPYEVPDGWEWVRFSAVTTEIATGPFGSMIHQSDYVDDGVPLINPSHMRNGKIIPDYSISVKGEKLEQLETHRLFTDDIVMARRGELGRCALVGEDSQGFLCGTGSFVIRFTRDVNRDYVVKLFKTSNVLVYLSGNSVGTTMVNLNHSILNNLPFPLPPLPEQRRIVAKIDELMALCDVLEARLSAQTGTQSALLGSLMAAITPASAVGPTRPRPARVAATASAEAAAPTEPKRRGRPAKVASPAAGRIPTASSEADAIRQLEELKFQRAEGTRQDGLFD